MIQDTGKGPLGVRIIAVFKVLSACLLIGLGVGVFRHVHDDPGREAEHIVASLKLDPGNHYIHSAITAVSGVKPSQLRAIGVGTFLYATLYMVEGIGLLLRKYWAEYFTVFATGSLIPVELYEVARHPDAIRVGVLGINVAIVGYLVYQLIRRRKAESVPAVT